MDADIISHEIGKSPILETEKEVAKLRNALGDWKPDGNDCVNNFMPAVRMAWLIIHKDQLEIRALAKKIETGDETSDDLRNMLKDIGFAAEAFFYLAEMCEAAKERVRVHVSAELRPSA